VDHREYIRMVPGSKQAVLFIHGIAGSPSHFRNLIPLLPEDCSVINLLLGGHGKNVEDFSGTSMKKWKAQVSTTVDNLLKQHNRISIVAHSMGTLFAIQEAINRPADISALFLLAVPLCPRLKFSAALNSIRLTQGWIPLDDKRLIAMRDATSILLDRQLWKYLGWIPRFVELLSETRRIRGILPRLSVPTQVFQSADDELVSPSSIKYLNRNPVFQTTILPCSGHYFYPEDDLLLLQSQFKKFIESL